MLVDIGGTKLFYEEKGKGTPLLFLHGFTLDRRMWSDQLALLSDRFRVITYDARGFGKSDKPTVGVPYRHCDDANALCEALGIEKVVAIGHSIGGHQMLEFVLTHPKRVRAFAGVAVSGIASVPFPEDVMALFGAVKQAAKEKGIAEAKKLWSTSGWFESARERPELRARLDVMLEDFSGWHWLNDNPVKNIEPPAAERLGEIAVPVAVISGERDLPYNTQIAEELVAKIRGATNVRMKGVGHMANMEDPVTFNAALVELASR